VETLIHFADDKFNQTQMKTAHIQTSNLFQTIRHSLFTTGLVALFAQTAQAQLPLPVYEPVPASYTNDTSANNENITVLAADPTLYTAKRLGGGVTTTVWPLAVGGGLGNGNVVAVGSGAKLTYPGLYQDPAANIGIFVRTNPTTANRTRGIRFTTTSSGSIYASFLMNVQNSPTNNRLFGKFETAISGTGSGGGGGAMAGIWLTSTNTLGISKSTTAAPDGTAVTPALTAGTHLVVAKYTWNGGTDDDEVALWLDPTFASFNVPEANIPSPTLTITSGTDVPSISSFYIHHPQSGSVPAGFFMDEIRIATTWADVTSTQALCIAASIATPPVNQTVNEGIGANLSVVAGGTSPNFQWQISTNSGTTWNNVNEGLGFNSQNFQTPVSTPADNGKQYRVIATVPCNGSSATSAVATVTVVNAVITPNGVVVDDVFMDGYNNLPYGISNSVWFSSDADSLNVPGSATSMLGTTPAGSVTWLGYFTDNSVTNLPVHLAVGRALRGTLVFKASNIISNGGSLRIGFFDYADGSTRIAANNFGGSPPGSTNVLGYMTSYNFGTNFTGNPFSLFARNNLSSTDLMGTTANYLSLGNGPADYNGDPAFQNDTTYTVEFTLGRQAVNSVLFTTKVSGGGTNWSHTVTDNTYAYPRFDTVAIRAGGAASSASSFEFTRLLVEVVTLQVSVPPFSISAIERLDASNVKVTWNSVANASYHIISRDSLSTGSWVTNATIAATGASTSYTNTGIGAISQRFYRVIGLPYTP